jgi:hypothetical protein
MVSEEGFSSAPAEAPRPESALASVAWELLFGRTLFRYVKQMPYVSLPIAILIVVVGGWLSSQTGLEPLLLFFVSPAVGVSRVWFILLFPLGWLGTFAISEALSRAFFHRHGGTLALLTSSAFAMLPLLIVPGIFYFFNISPGTPDLSSVLVPVVVLAWVMCLLAAAVSFSKGLELKRTSLISLAVLLLNILVLVVSFQAGLF